MINVILNLRQASNGSRLPSKEDIESAMAITVLEGDSYQSLCLKIKSALPAKFMWDESMEQIRYQRNRNQGCSTLESITPECDFYDLFAQTQLRNITHDTPISLWIFGSFQDNTETDAQNDAVRALACLSSGTISLAHKSPQSPVFSTDSSNISYSKYDNLQRDGSQKDDSHFENLAEFQAATFHVNRRRSNFYSGRNQVCDPSGSRTQNSTSRILKTMKPIITSSLLGRSPKNYEEAAKNHQNVKRKFDYDHSSRPNERSKSAKQQRVKMLTIEGVEYVILNVKLNGAAVELPIELESLKSVLEFTKLKQQQPKSC